jgi:hypothetical protein
LRRIPPGTSVARSFAIGSCTVRPITPR